MDTVTETTNTHTHTHDEEEITQHREGWMGCRGENEVVNSMEKPVKVYYRDI